MKSKKLLYLAMASCSLFFASCSMNKNSMSSSNSDANKMQYAQQLEAQKVAPTKSIDNLHVSSEINVPESQSDLSITGLKTVSTPILQKHKKLNTAIKLAKVYFHSPVLIATKAVNEMAKIRNASTHASAHKDLPFADSNLLVMWIVFLLASILLYIIAGLFAAASLPGILFTILGLIAGLIFLYFLILWIISLYQASKK